MSNYKIKKLINGSFIKPEFTGSKMIAVPDNKLTEDCKVIYNNETMLIPKGLTPAHRIQFVDKYNRSLTYWLNYFYWTPTESQLNFL